MSFTPISNDFIQYSATSSGTSAAGYFLKLYAAGTSNPISTALDSAGSVLVAKTELDSLGFAKNGSGGATTLYIDQAYRLVLYINATDADANTFGNAVQDIDDIPQLATRAASTETVKNFATLALAVADTGLVVGDAVDLEENVSGSGGGGRWYAVLSSTVTENTFNTVQCVGVPTLSLVLRIEDSTLNLLQIGATIGGDLFATWNHALTLDAVAIIKLPRDETASLSATIVISKAVRVDGAGGPDASKVGGGGQPGTSTTKIICTGSNINGIEIGGTGTEGLENVHLSNFSLWGHNVAGGGGLSVMNDGIQLGSPSPASNVGLTKSSLINVHVKGFDKIGKLGVRFIGVLEFYLENVYTQFNYHGIGNLNGDICTTIRMMNCHSRTNIKNGMLIQGGFQGSAIVGFISEGNSGEGLVIAPGAVDVQQDINFYDYYSEANASGIAPIVIGNGAGSVSGVNFYGGNVVDDAVANFGGKVLHLDRAEKVVFDNVTLQTTNAGFMEATANTSSCQFRTAIASIVETDVTGNAAANNNPSVRIMDGVPNIKVGSISRDISAVDGAVVESGLGFLPRVIQFQAAVDNTSMMSKGMSDGTAQFSIHDSNGVTTDTYGVVTGTIVLRSGGSVLATGTVTITTIGEFTITWAKTGSPTGTATIFYTVHG